ncbi:N-6 DNA methylase [Pseudonocardia sp. GCM10023141]|uniref:N-6 DNA methylase n=1 Tax=Pseudonocardia sp. GCM10023141 TaxID=3252653 RepID=UPI00360D40AF
MTGDTTVSAGDIARLGGVGRAAVSNWRRRHHDFPAPVAGTASSPRFALADVEAWFRANGRPYRLSPADRAWQRLHPDGNDLLVAARVADAGQLLLRIHDPALLDRLPGAPTPVPHDPELHRALAELADALGPAAAFEEICARHRARPAPAEELATAMARIALPGGGTLLDPACGTGSLLLTAAPRLALGQHSDADAARIAAARLLLAGVDADIVAADALQSDAFAGRSVDGVVCDPPPGDRPRGHGELAGDPRFAHGLPPRTEPELAWLQHALAAVRPGGPVVIRMPAAAAARRAGRRIRSNLLRAGALRAVITVPDGDLWVLRRPAATDPTPAHLLVAQVDVDRAAPLWEAFSGGRDVPDGAAVPIVDLLDDDVDVSPERHLQRGRGPDPGRAFTELRTASATAVPVLEALTEPLPLATATVAELSRAGALRVRHAPTRMTLGGGGVAVLTVTDLAVGTEPTGRTAAGPALVRIRPGDVVAAAMGRVRVASTRAALGPGLTAYRVDPERLDAEYLAGVLRSAPPPTGSGSTRYGQRVRIPLLSPEEQRAYGVAFRELLAAADTARDAAERADALLRVGGEGLVEGWLRPGG